jgi:predicted transcriptional regulator
MIRTQIQLAEEQSRRLHEVARCSGVSVAEVIRRSVDMYLEREPLGTSGIATREAAAQLIGPFHSGTTDIAARHDDYLDEAYAG